MFIPTVYLPFLFFELDLVEELTLLFSRGFFARLASLNEASSTCSVEVCCLIEDLAGLFLNGEESLGVEILNNQKQLTLVREEIYLAMKLKQGLDPE